MKCATLPHRAVRGLAGVLVIAGALFFCAPVHPAGAALTGRLLDVADMPRGWHEHAISPSSVSTVKSGCLAHATTSPRKGVRKAETYLTEGAGLPSFTEVLLRDSKATSDWAKGAAVLSKCSSLTFRLGTLTVHASLNPLTLPTFADSSSAFVLHFTVAGLSIVEDLALFRQGDYEGFLEYADTVSQSASTFVTLARAAVSKVEGVAVHVAALSVTSIRETEAHSTDGSVGYRVFGSGPPLVLITGYSGTMESWDPRFVDALAQHFRVYIFDNAGIGRTTAVEPLTVDAMADQTSAFISALGLARPDVLGWSMGSMIAQALAVRHPDQVRRLVLCATYPGDGSAVVPPQKNIDALKSGVPTKELAELFPPSQQGAAEAYATATADFPAANPAPEKVVAGQATAITSWWAGKDVAGRHSASIAVPTLIADGSEDRLDASKNDQDVANIIHGAKLALFQGAGHAFLFQDEAAFVPKVVAFLK